MDKWEWFIFVSCCCNDMLNNTEIILVIFSGSLTGLLLCWCCLQLFQLIKPCQFVSCVYNVIVVVRCLLSCSTYSLSSLLTNETACSKCQISFQLGGNLWLGWILNYKTWKQIHSSPPAVQYHHYYSMCYLLYTTKDMFRN